MKPDRTFVVGADKNHEDLLPWWFENIKRHSPKPDITIANLGLSSKMRKWAKDHSDTFLEYDVPTGRAWFYKPRVMIDAPYEYVCWVDSDCEVMKPIDNVFDYPTTTKIALTLDIVRMGWIGSAPPSHKSPIWWATGVNCAKGKPAILNLWAMRCAKGADRGDQEVLVEMVKEDPTLNEYIVQLPLVYQWLRLSLSENYDSPQKKIVHWTGPHGKKHIRDNLMR